MRQSLPALATAALLACSVASVVDGQTLAPGGDATVPSPTVASPQENLPEEEEAASREPEPIVGEPIEEGFFVFNGRYVPPPYTVRQEGEEVFVNDHLAPEAWSAGPFFGYGMRGPGRGRWGGGRQPSQFAQTQRQFNEGALLFVFEDGPSGYIVPQNAVEVLTILLSDASNEEKTESLSDGRFPRFATDEWEEIVERFESTSELRQRIQQIEDEKARILEEAMAARQRVELLDSSSFKYGITLVAMVLVVVAMGRLLNHRPTRGSRWTDIDQEGDGVAMLKWNVALLFLLNGFDLALTLLAQQAGGFLELNPLGDKLASNPAYLAAFKISVLLISCLILLSLRKYRGAQAASWWLCFVCTILTFRWVTYNSMFLS